MNRRRSIWRLLPVRLLTLALAVLLLCTACGSDGSDSEEACGALTWSTWGNYNRFKKFIEVLGKSCPDIDVEFISYMGSNPTGYSWLQMRADDIPDIFVTSQILDQELAKERLVDLSSYLFINNLPNSVLDQVSLDGGIYLLPVNYSMYGIFYNKTLMEEKGWEVPSDFAELSVLCDEIREEGLIPGVVGTRLTGGPFSAVFNLAKTGWLTTPEGAAWEREFLAGNASAQGRWESTMDYVQSYIDIGMFYTDPQDRNSPELIFDYLGNRKAVFCTVVQPVSITEFPDTGDKLGMMPYIGEDGSKNVYMYNPSFYIGISKRLMEPGNEKKLENAIRILSLIYSEEGQAAFVDETTPSVMSILKSSDLPKDSLIYDAQQALRQGRAFPMTYVGWEQVLSDMGQAYKEWFRGENSMDGESCIARMDELWNAWMNRSEEVNFCESTADFTLEETAELLGKALGSAAGTDVVLVPIGGFHEGNVELASGVTGKLYKGSINSDVTASLCPATDGAYAVMTMTGAQIEELVQTGFDAAGDGNPFPYLLVTKEGETLQTDRSYQVAFFGKGYTEETAEAYSAQTFEGSLQSFLREWLEQQGTVSPGGNPWE
ncbi:MAG: carbohydrate ABC transporter substrate-binding protein [Lachnospiraceae bacterium]|nr:carbohydrate ABC transporter substrate-binding protein [Lachnospiraceae bacterium]